MTKKKEKTIKKEPTKIDNKGEKPVWQNDEKLEQRIKIWIDWSYLKLPIWDIEKRYDVSKSTVKQAISFVNKYFIKIPNKELLRGAIFGIETRINKLTEQLDKEYKFDVPSIRNIKELNSEIRADNIELLKLQNLLKEKYEIDVGGGSIKEILKVLAEKK